jgi:hypothetical protein
MLAPPPPTSENTRFAETIVCVWLAVAVRVPVAPRPTDSLADDLRCHPLDATFSRIGVIVPGSEILRPALVPEKSK